MRAIIILAVLLSAATALAARPNYCLLTPDYDVLGEPVVEEVATPKLTLEPTLPLPSDELKIELSGDCPGGVCPTSGSCPGGNCPTQPTYTQPQRGLFGRLFSR